jgi:hypothetical protein
MARIARADQQLGDRIRPQLRGMLDQVTRHLGVSGDDGVEESP